MRANKDSSQRKPQKATRTAARKKSAEDILMESIGELIDSAARKMSAEEFRRAARRTNQILDRALAAVKGDREA
jgi:hypothetical protein